MSSEGEDGPPLGTAKMPPAEAQPEPQKPNAVVADERKVEEKTEEPEDSKPAAVPSLPPQMQSSVFEDDGTFALPPGEAYKTTTPASTPAISANAPDIANSKGAQIIMGRFSNWRQKANENANILWKQAKEAQEKAAENNQGPLAVLRQAAGVNVGVGTPRKNADEVGENGGTGSGGEDHGKGDGKEEEKEEGFMVYGDEDGKLGDGEKPNSARALPNIQVPTRAEMRSRAQKMASGVIGQMDSYATDFRGRYANSNDPQRPPPASPSRPNKESQTSLILKSRAASHLQDILDSLEPYQYVLLLGAGRLQVNLKNPYVKHQGTYVDFLVTGGAADKSGVVGVGDSIVKVAAQDVRKHTIADVPSIIANAKRPAVLVLATGVEMDVERITYLDLCVAMMHQIRAKDEQQKKEMIASATKNKHQSLLDVEEETEESDVARWEMEDRPKEEEPEESSPAFEAVKIPPIRTVEDYANPPQPPVEARLAYKHMVGKRCNDNFSVTHFSQFAASDDDFRAALRNAFLSCAVDGRRFPFLGRHLTMEQDVLESNSSKQEPNKNAPNALLMLFLELNHFSDLHGVTPVSRRKAIAERIAYKFFLPTKVKVDSTFRLEPPMFDFHHLVSDSELRTLEGKLALGPAEIPQDIFLDFQHAVVDALCGTTFLLFLVSNHCARMRGYLRNSAPYRNIPLKCVFAALTNARAADSGALSVHSGSKNYFLYILIYLVQLEKDPTSTLSTDGSTLLGRNGRRMVGAAGGLCCYIFMGRVVVPAVEKFKQQLQEAKSEETKSTNEKMPATNKKHGDSDSIVNVFGRLWELFLAPGVGALEHTWKSKETKEHLEILRAKLRAIRKEVMSSTGVEVDGAANKLFAQKFGNDAALLTALKDVADHLLYDYAIHTHSKFREHIFHEWLCNEFVKATKEKSKETSEGDEEKEAASQLPELPTGCIKRLLRKVDLPVGVSPHKPLHSNNSGAKKPPAAASNPNADCAVVFGSSVGAELACRMQSPAMDHSDIRRYTCQDCTQHGEKLPDSFEEQFIPPTLESYAVIPPTRVTGFSEVTGNVALSSDGWEVSMVNFNIPKAGSDDEPQSLFGVSLVFQRSPTARFHPRRISQTQLVRDKNSKDDEKKTAEGNNVESNPTLDEDGTFPSPVSFDTPSDDHWSSFSRSMKVSEDMPVFNGYLREKAWVDRVLQDEDRDQNVAPTIGVALVARRNVVIAMRQALWMFLRDFSRLPEDNHTRKDVITCGSLVDLLGNFAHQDVEPMALKCILEPYIRAASATWIDRPLSAPTQEDIFLRHAGQQLITCLPPIPLALLFIAALLEQKIILSSSRRSILFSATEALTGMLKPLKWCHLIVPLVPAALAKDLVQYPAPFILGCNSEEPAVMNIMSELPNDVTLVDLDVGRVILAPDFSFDSSGMTNTDPANSTMTALRSQVLYLAQILGSHFGAKLFRDSWSCDSPSLSLRENSKLAKTEADYDILRSVCSNFIEELLAGVSSSCFWIEEEEPAMPVDKKKHGASEPTVLFDEDRFFFIKRWREENGYEPLLEYSEQVNRSLALSMDGFNLVLECFVRCQSMNWYLSSQSKHRMAFSL